MIHGYAGLCISAQLDTIKLICMFWEYLCLCTSIIIVHRFATNDEFLIAILALDTSVVHQAHNYGH